MDPIMEPPMDDAPEGFVIRGHRSDPEGTIIEIVVPKGTEAEYPIGSTVTLACEEGMPMAEAVETYPDNLQGRRAKEEDSLIARTKGYREEA